MFDQTIFVSFFMGCFAISALSNAAPNQVQMKSNVTPNIRLFHQHKILTPTVRDVIQQLTFESPFRKAFIDSLRSPHRVPSPTVAQILAPYTNVWEHISKTAPQNSNSDEPHSKKYSSSGVDIDSASSLVSNYIHKASPNKQTDLSQSVSLNQPHLDAESITSDRHMHHGQGAMSTKSHVNKIASSPPAPPPLPPPLLPKSVENPKTSLSESASQIGNLNDAFEQGNEYSEIDPSEWTFEEKVEFYEKRIQAMKLMNEILSGQSKK
ncbi:uncharacterized protein LOC116337869 [Contarinia nasturtii]|uniref:uncharacterized protein LOC116337869 n=1 Tax=Contarinia nasturtii TaxID=265458 RepID=UPI0012D3C75D|nr:uncharacterized protein LOC116337869 [Contarinia nasturtii]